MLGQGWQEGGLEGALRGSRSAHGPEGLTRTRVCHERLCRDVTAPAVRAVTSGRRLGREPLGWGAQAGRALNRLPPHHHRIRKGFPCEARVVARVLPQFLDDFFPPQDVMNKVIGEFLSSQQPYPQFMATVVYQVRGRGGAPRAGAGPSAPPLPALMGHPRARGLLAGVPDTARRGAVVHGA